MAGTGTFIHTNVDTLVGTCDCVVDMDSVICPDLNQAGFPEAFYVSQWISSIGSEMYHAEAERFTRSAKDRDRVIAERGLEQWELYSYPLKIDEHDFWFLDLFFIQKCDWRSLQQVFCQVDDIIRGDTINHPKVLARKRLGPENLVLVKWLGWPEKY